MLSSPVCDLAPELQTSKIPEGFMKHPVYKMTIRYDVGDFVVDPWYTMFRKSLRMCGWMREYLFVSL
jgi:hypothetical protein